MVVHEGSRAALEGCTLRKNGQSGTVADAGSVVEVKGCNSSGHVGAGYKSQRGAHMTVSTSSTDGDGQDCGESGGGQLTIHEFSVDGVVRGGRPL